MAVPKGIRVRSSPDWYSRFCSTGAVQVIGGAPTHFQYISLYNNASDGSYLYVHWLMAVAAVASAMVFFFMKGSQGTLQSACTRINPALPAPPGQMFLLDNGAAALTNPIILLQSTFTGGALAGGAPILVVPPGWSLMAGTPVADSAPGLAVQYIPMIDLYGRQAT